MRQLYEKHSAMAFIENNKGFEDGLLEKILNLAFAGLSMYSSKLWEITAVKSPVLLQKLYKAAGDKRIAECAYTLIICDRSTEYSIRAKGHDIDLLSLSISYAAKFYCVDCCRIRDFDERSVARELCVGNQHDIAAIICLGFFKAPACENRPLLLNRFSVKVI
jgi:hypothetical protein